MNLVHNFCIYPSSCYIYGLVDKINITINQLAYQFISINNQITTNILKKYIFTFHGSKIIMPNLSYRFRFRFTHSFAHLQRTAYLLPAMPQQTFRKIIETMSLMQEITNQRRRKVMPSF